jgi:hypothetical protein
MLAGHSVTIGAALATRPASSASLSVKVLNPLPVLTSGSVTAAARPGSYLVDVHGSGFMSTSQLQISGANVAAAFISATELQSTISLPAGMATVEVGVLNPDAAQNSPVTRALAVPPVPLASLTESARLLDQTTFGPTLSAIQHVQAVGAAAYLKEQFAIPTTPMPAIPDPPVALCPDATFRCAQSSFWKNALTANDQLRQRVAFALSEIFVVSTDEVNARTIPSYHNLLANDAFGNFSQVMNDVATSPAMGAYLNMLDSGAAPAGQIANENFARELMQLFTTGLFLLDPDGSLELNEPDGWLICELSQWDTELRSADAAGGVGPRHDGQDPADRRYSPRRTDRATGSCRGDRLHPQPSQRGPFRWPSAYPAPGHKRSFTGLCWARRGGICQRWVRCPRRYEGGDHGDIE